MIKITITLMVALLAVGCSQAPRQTPLETGKLTQGSAKFQTLSAASKLKIYEGHPRLTSAKDVAAEGRKLGIEATPVDEGEIISVTQGQKRLWVDKKYGIETYEDRTAEAAWDGLKPVKKGESPTMVKTNTLEVPNEAVCKELAERFIKERHLSFNEPYVFYQFNEQYESSASTSETRVTQREVVFKRLVDGHIVHGPGSQISVYVSDGGQVTKAVVDWPMLVAKKEVSIKAHELAQGKADGKLGKLNAVLKEEARVKEFHPVHSRLDYVGFKNQDGSTDVSPSYLIIGDAVALDGTKRSQLLFLDASDEAPLPDPR